MKKQAKRPAMSATEARSFRGFSIGNATTVLSATTEHGCSCDPYTDVFTFGRWKAQGLVVQRGQHAIAKLPVFIETEPTEEHPSGRKIMHSSSVFCRCQVGPS